MIIYNVKIVESIKIIKIVKTGENGKIVENFKKSMIAGIADNVNIVKIDKLLRTVEKMC
jgi:hypothetical protein